MKTYECKYCTFSGTKQQLGGHLSFNHRDRPRKVREIFNERLPRINCIHCKKDFTEKQWIKHEKNCSILKKLKLKNRSFDELPISLKRKSIIEEVGGKCEKCFNSIWIDQPIALELDHIDGNADNNKRENLRILCPNCHAQTETYRGKNVV